MIDPNAYYTSGLGVRTYDPVYGTGAISGDLEFYLGCAQRYGGPILEMAAGTGRLTIPLAEAGFDVTGLDISAAMLDMAKAKLANRPEIANRIEWHEADMRSFALNRDFALAIVPARSLHHVIAPEDQRAVLQCLRRHLKPGGHLIIHLFDPDFDRLVAEKPPAPTVREAGEAPNIHTIRRTTLSCRCDFLRQTMTEVMLLELLDPRGQVIAQEETSWTLRWIPQQEMAYLLELCGFKVRALYSDFKQSPPAYGRDQVWVAQAC